jgi:hypothetical protein
MVTYDQPTGCHLSGLQNAAPMIAALYVQADGCYVGLPEVDPWPEARDARLYAGPWPVVAHPPCARWGSYWYGSPSSSKRFALGDDGGCFAAALASVRRWGGVLEHPAHSRAWRFHGLKSPRRSGWCAADALGGMSAQVDQGHYGHKAKKPTWLYVCGAPGPVMTWGPSSATASIDGSKNRAARARGIRSPSDIVECLGKRERSATPIPFRDLLLSIARSATPRTDANCAMPAPPPSAATR